MDDKIVRNQISNLYNRKEQIDNNISRQRDQMARYQETLDRLTKQSNSLDAQINNLKSKLSDVEDVVEEDADASITTGSLDASSDGNGAVPSWRFYSKVGEIQRRSPTKKKKKKKRVYESYIESFGGALNE